MSINILSKYATALFTILVLSFASGANEATRQDIQVELNPQKPLWLRVTLRSRAETPITFYKERLPWGNRYSMILVAVKPDGRCLQEFFPIDDPGIDKVTLAPGAALSGDIDLGNFFKDLEGASKESDVNVFWAYEAPPEMHVARRSGGWILIPQRK
jgi:hypothetical protein